MTHLLSNRKRVRENEEEDKPDCIPLSKRINNLHIDGGSAYNSLSLLPLCKHSCSSQVGAFSSAKPQLSSHNDRSSEMNPVSNCNGSSRTDDTAVPQYSYNPDLSPSDNPHYYESNKLLFNLFIERIQRNNVSAMHMPY